MNVESESDVEQLPGIGASTITAFAALLLALIILAAWTNTFFHEALGHCLTLELLGGTAEGFRIDWFGGGQAYGLDLPGNWLPKFLHDFSGMMVNVATAMLALLWLKLGQPRTTLRLGLMVFALMATLGPMAYACLGLYYDFGDASGWADRIPFVGRYLWLPFLIAAPFVANLLMKPYVGLQQRMFPIAPAFRRVSFSILTLGSATVALAALNFATSNLHRVEFPKAARAQAVERVRVAKREVLRKELRRAYPQASAHVIEERVERTPIVVEPEEAHVGPWIAIAYVVFTIAGGLAALWRGARSEAEMSRFPGKGALIVSWFAVALGLAVLWYCGNEFPWPRFG